MGIMAWTTFDTTMTIIMFLIAGIVVGLALRSLGNHLNEVWDEDRTHAEKFALRDRAEARGLDMDEVVERSRAFKGFICWSTVERIIDQAEEEE